jgi:hypothetical protein
MDNQPKQRNLLSKISGNLGILIGGGLAILTGFMRPAVTSFPSLSLKSPIETASVLATRPLPPKLVLMQTRSGFRMIAQHDSHSSHDSHASHASHASHVSGGFV